MQPRNRNTSTSASQPPMLALGVLLALAPLSAAAGGTYVPHEGSCSPGEQPAAPGPDSGTPVSMLQTSLTTRHRSSAGHDDVYEYVEELIEQRAVHGQLGREVVMPTSLAAAFALAPNATAGNATNSSAAAAAGVGANKAGDLPIFLVALGTNTGILLFCILLFSCLRKRFPLVYQHKVEPIYVEELQAEQEAEGRAPPAATTPPAAPGGSVRDIFTTNFYTRRQQGAENLLKSQQGAEEEEEHPDMLSPGLPRDPPETFFGWIGPSCRLTVNQVNQAAGLDHALLIEFCHLAMKILGLLIIPCLLVLAPLHAACGGDAAGQDHLSYLGFANVTNGNWLVFVQAGLTWYVCGMVNFMVFRAMRQFVPLRYEWMKEMPEPRSNTVLVEGIPEEMNSAPKVKAYFDDEVFGRDVVDTVYIVKDTSELVYEKRNMDKLKLQLEKESPDPVADGPGLHTQIREAETKVATLQDYINGTDDLNSANAFVTFKSRREANIAVKLFGEDDMEKVLVTSPPEPQDVIWADLLVNPTAQFVREWVGFGLLVSLYLFTIPAVIGISAVTDLHNLQQHVPFFNTLVTNFPAIATVWNALVGAVGLTLLMSFVPTFMRLIFSNFFLLRAKAWMQHKLQKWYFYYLIVFVLLITAIGQGLIATFNTLLKSPMKVFALLGSELPKSTHFYLNYFPVQWATQGMNLTRYIPLGKYLFFRMIYNQETAHKLSEPEDQDFYGIGSRSARFTLLLVTAITFSTLSPLITALAVVNFAICRMFFTYLFVYAEQRKPDLGGEFYVTQLRHVQQGLFLFVAVMTGCLFERSTSMKAAYSWLPGTIAALNFFPLYLCYRWFAEWYRWEALDFKEADESSQQAHKLLKARTYKQPELIPDESRPVPQGTLQTAQGNIQHAMSQLQSRLGLAAPTIPAM